MKIQTIATLALTTLLAGCVSPKSVLEVRTSQKRMTSVCSELSVDEAVARIGNAWKRCLRDRDPGSQAVMVNGLPLVVPVAKGAPIFVNSELTGDGQTVSLGLAKTNTVLMIADVRKTEACASLVEARGWNTIWNSTASKVRLFLKEPDADCPR